MKKITKFFTTLFFGNLLFFCPLFCFLSAQPYKNSFENNKSEQNELEGLPLFDNQYVVRKTSTPRTTKKK